MTTSAVSAVAPVHEEVHAEADGQWEQKRQGAEDMGAMFDPEKNSGDSQEHTERESRWSVQERPLAAFVQARISG
jgi:hypothetical protein